MTEDVQSSHLRRSHDLGSNLSRMIRSMVNPVSQYAYLLSPAILGGQISSSRFSSLGLRWSNGYDSGRLSRWPGRSTLSFEGGRDGVGPSWASAGFFPCFGGWQNLPLAIKWRLSTAFPVAARPGMHISLFASAIWDNPWLDGSYSWLDAPGLFEEEIWSVRTSGASMRHLAMETNENKERLRIERMDKNLTVKGQVASCVWIWKVDKTRRESVFIFIHITKIKQKFFFELSIEAWNILAGILFFFLTSGPESKDNKTRVWQVII